MKVLILGANGYIGQHIATHLYNHNHEISCGIHKLTPNSLGLLKITLIQIDFLTQQDINVWRERVSSYDAVINCVGILHGNEQIQNQIHFETPKTIYQACLENNIKYIHLSALGINENIKVPYAQSKLKFDKYLQTQPGKWVILRPSLIYCAGTYGGTSLFRGLAALPGIIPVYNPEQKFSPIYMQDLCLCIERVLTSSYWQCIINLVGPQEKTLREILTLIRKWLGFPQAKITSVPKSIIKPICLVGNFIKEIPINETSLAMMASENTASHEDMEKKLGVIPLTMDEALRHELSHVQDRWHAKLYFFSPVIRIVLSLFWILSGLIGLITPQQSAMSDLFFAFGLPATLTKINIISFCSLDILLGVALLIGWRVKLILWLQIMIIIAYTLCFTLFFPEFWLDPFGSILKNMPILILTFVALIISEQR